MIKFALYIALIALLFVFIKAYIIFAYKFFEIAREILDRIFDRE